MKKIHIYLLLCLCLGPLALVSCKKEAKLDLTGDTKATIVVNADVVSQAITFNSLIEWNASLTQEPNDSWASIDKTSGTGGASKLFCLQ